MPGTADILAAHAATEIAELCGVDISTARRWKRGVTTPPPSALLLLAGDLGVLDPAWSGWSTREGLLVSPEGLLARPGDVRAIPYHAAARSALEARIRQLEQEKGAALAEQPLPDEWLPVIERLLRA